MNIALGILAILVILTVLALLPRLVRFCQRRPRTVIGIGVEVAYWKSVPNAWVFAAVHPQGPAGRAGIKPGDSLLKIDSSPVLGLPRRELRRRLRRGLGASIALTVRSGEDVRTHALHFERVRFPLPEVKLESPFAVPSDGVVYHPRITNGMTVSLTEKVKYSSHGLTETAQNSSL